MEILRWLGDVVVTLMLFGAMMQLAGVVAAVFAGIRQGEFGFGGALFGALFLPLLTAGPVLVIIALARALTGAPRWLGYLGL